MPKLPPTVGPRNLIPKSVMSTVGVSKKALQASEFIDQKIGNKDGVVSDYELSFRSDKFFPSEHAAGAKELANLLAVPRASARLDLGKGKPLGMPGRWQEGPGPKPTSVPVSRFTDPVEKKIVAEALKLQKKNKTELTGEAFSRLLTESQLIHTMYPNEVARMVHAFDPPWERPLESFQRSLKGGGVKLTLDYKNVLAPDGSVTGVWGTPIRVDHTEVSLTVGAKPGTLLRIDVNDKSTFVKVDASGKVDVGALTDRDFGVRNSSKTVEVHTLDPKTKRPVKSVFCNVYPGVINNNPPSSNGL